jgi:tetratricopeptide (TPR) repeat protein
MREVGDQWGVAVALANLGDLAMRQGDLERAAAVVNEALALGRQVGDRERIAVCLLYLGVVARKRGDLASAEALGREALALFREFGDPRRCAAALEQLAATAGVAGQGARAARLLGAATTVQEVVGAPPPAPERADTAAAVAPARTALGEDAWATAFAVGQALSLEEAVAEALRTEYAPQRPPHEHDHGDHQGGRRRAGRSGPPEHAS